MSKSRLFWVLAAGLGLLLLIAGIGRLTTSGTTKAKGTAFQQHRPHIAALQARGEKGQEAGAGPAQETYDNRALPHKNVSYAQVKANLKAFQRLGLSSQYKLDQQRSLSATATWQELGPVTATVPASSTYTGRATTVSGRVSAMAIGSTCVSGNCPLYVGAAGGGVWKTSDAMATTPTWSNSWSGPTSNAIGSIVIDPSNANTIWVGTGEPSGSSDSEAGVGLYKSTDGGSTWSLISSSVAISKDRAIGTIAVDPTDSNHILIGTDVARHGSSSVNGGRYTPPNAPVLGVYETTNGGSSWTKVLELPQDTVDGTSANGNDFFAGGITKILFDPNFATTPNIYASSFTSGLWRNQDGSGSNWAQIFHAQDDTDTFERTEFALADMGTSTKIWAGSGDSSGYDPAMLWRVTDSSDAAANLLASQDVAGCALTKWCLLSSSTLGEDGYTSYNFCQDQCSYDMGVWSPPVTGTDKDLVVLQGAMRYQDIFTGPAYSNGGTVVRSLSDGQVFTDMTNDTLSNPNGLHPDHRAVVFSPNDHTVMFFGSDGGVARVGPTYTDASSDCSSRSLTSAGLATCQDFLLAIPNQIFPLNVGLPTLQFQSVSVSAKKPSTQLLGGTQDNGTWAFDCSGGLPCTTTETINGDGGQSAINAKNNTIRTHSYYNPYYDTNFDTNNPVGWDWISDSFFTSDFSALLEAFSFYPPLIQDPVNGGYLYTGGQHVWRTTDNGGARASLDAHCNEASGDFTIRCGDWQMLATSASDGGDLTTGSSTDKGTGYVVAIERAPSDKTTMWVGTRRGRIFVSTNANASSAAAVRFNRIDTSTQPRRFPSGITVDPNNPNHAFISFSGYDAYTPTTTGHVFEVTYKPSSKTATWKNLSKDLGDQPVTDIEYVKGQKTLYAATDFGVLSLKLGASSWHDAASGLPMGAVYGLRQIPGSGWLYAATHGRGVWRLQATVCVVPKVTGKTLSAAKKAIKAGHCKTGKIKRAYSNKVKKNKVSKQSPAALQQVAVNTKVALTVSKGKKKRH